MRAHSAALVARATEPGYLAIMDEVTRILDAIEGGDPRAASRLLPLVYDELRRLAARKIDREKPGQTLTATALVHEAYIRLVSRNEDCKWDGRGHFFAAAAEAMRRILVDNARHKAALKCGGDRMREQLDEAQLIMEEPREDLLALDEALEKLARVEPLKAELVKLRYFAGLTAEQAATTLGISTTTADRYWAYARAWLRTEMREDDPSECEDPARKEK
jgi:RNA polymerase sigma factor (TIGR02999 family)